MAQGAHGQQSRALLTSLAPVGSNVTLKVVDTDRYGRTVAEIIRGGQNVNLRIPGGIQRPWDFRHGRRGYRPAARQGTGAAAGPPPEERRYRCSQIGSYAQAQVLLRQGHTYLDGNGDGEACENLRW